MPNGSDRITSHSLQELQPTKTVDDPEIKAWLSLGTKAKKKGGGKKKKGKFEIIAFQPLQWFVNRYVFLINAFCKFLFPR